MSGQHTKEPWNVSSECAWTVDHDRYSSYSWAGIEASGETVALAVSHRSDDLMEANARRIVAAVNACAGIPTEDLEAVTSFETAGVTTVRAVKKQRDELLAALEALRSACFDRRIANDEFERLGALYYGEFGRLRPGKDDPLRDSGDEENVRQYEVWSRRRTESALDLADAAIARAQGEAK